MNLLLGVFGILALVILLTLLGCRSTSSRAKPVVERQYRLAQLREPGLLAEKWSDTRKYYAERLDELARSEPPKELAMGAMCYWMGEPPDRAEYICPECGERTLYAKRDSMEGDRRVDGAVMWDLGEGIAGCRRYTFEIKSISLELDESQFCSHCSPDVDYPVLGIVIHYRGEDKPHRVWGVKPADVRLISEFLAGKVRHRCGNDEEVPLLEYIGRLRELFGVKRKEFTEEK